jgi:hypothetical protein
MYVFLLSNVVLHVLHLVEPVLYYGAGIWGQSKWREVRAIQNKACRLYLGSFKNASNLATQGDMGFMSTESAQYLEVYRLLLRIENAEDNRLTLKIHNVSKDLGGSWDKKCEENARNLNITHVLRGPYSNSRKLRSIRSVLGEKDNESWVQNLHDNRNQVNGNKLRTYRIYKTQLCTSSYVKSVLIRSHRRVLANFRSVALYL